MTKLTILAPAYNEQDVIADFVNAVSGAAPEDAEILVVDDGSTDGTAAILEELRGDHPQVRVVAHSRNRGLGAALATGFREATGTVIVTMDADLSHPLELIDRLVAACEHADAAYGSRYVPGGGMIGVPWWRRLISRAANIVLRIAYLAPVQDLTTGYRAYRSAAVRDLTVTGQRFEAQLEISIRLISAGRHIVEIPLVLENRAAGESKMRYLSLIPAYASMALRMLAVRWLSIFGGWARR
jgi:dolichol-phosphate mannosyltransferase